mmetsp:Transcript_22660/g.51787  ORF Transcript_22660/g.51787 Transcript_22660/m.51787 type:complete len:382 (-) Transcript_22660:111-1256(-)
MDLEAVVDAISEADLPVARRHEGLSTLRKLLTNIRDSPEQVKFRRISKANPAILSRLFPACFDLLRASGFRDEGDVLLYQGDPRADPVFEEALSLVESMLMSLDDAKQAAPVHPSSASSAPVSAQPRPPPIESKRALQQQRQDKIKQEAKQAQATAQEQLASLRRQRANRYQEEQDTALAHHLSGRDADSAFDAISALNVSRGAVHSFVTCSRCGSSLRYSSATRAQAVLCPCGNLLQPVHMRGQAFAPRSPSDLPVEPGEPVDADNRPRATRGPFISVRGPDGQPARLPLHSVLQMVRQHEDRQTAGAEDETIEALPTRTFEGGAAGTSAEDRSCQICMEDFTEGDELRTLPCFHLFHAKCVDQWLKVNSICPTCRHKVG